MSDRTCSIPGCTRAHKAKGFCMVHYMRLHRYGDPLATGDIKPQLLRSASVSDRFWVKVDKAGPIPIERPDLGPCWLWTSTSQQAGYGQFHLDGRYQCAHRVAYELVVGPIPEGLEIDHLCFTPACVNPSHHEAVTSQVNYARRRPPLRGSNGRVAQQEMCNKGLHCLSGDNLVPDQFRRCRECRNEWRREWRRKRRLAVLSYK